MTLYDMALEPREDKYYVVLSEIHRETNNSVLTGIKRKAITPALISFSSKNGQEPGKILYKGTFFESIGPLYDQAGARIWPAHHILDQSFVIRIENRLYTGNFSFIHDITPERVLFSDGSTLRGVHALFIYFDYEKRFANTINLIDTSYEHLGRTIIGFSDPRAIHNHFFEAKYVPHEPLYSRTYQSGDSLNLERYELPIYNNSPYAICLHTGEHVPAIGWQDDIWSYPDGMLNMTSRGSLCSFSEWNEEPYPAETGLKLAGTVIEYDSALKILKIIVRKGVV